jgi:DNA-binding CsgD family transcriptional regulator
MPALDLYGTRIPTEREQRVIHLVAQGLKNGEVAKEIGTTQNVVRNYLRVIFDKLGLGTRLELALWHESRRVDPANPNSEPVVPTETQTASLLSRTPLPGPVFPQPVCSSVTDSPARVVR